MGFITNWDSKCCPRPGVGPASGFPLTALICENTILWQGNNLLSAKASSCFHQGGKKKKRNYFLPNLKRAALPPGPGTHPATDRPEHPRTHPKYAGWDRKTSAAHLQKCMAAPKANAVWAGITRKLKRKALCVISCIANTAY